MNELTNYLPMLLALVLALTLVTNIIVQVLKSLLYDMLPTNLLAFLVAAVVTVGAGFGLWSYYRFAITGWMIVALIPLIGITNWLLIPFAAVGAIIAGIGLLFTRSANNGRAKAGLILNGIVIVVAVWRLGLGGGVL